MSNTIIRLFRDTNMSYQHDSLAKIAKRAKVDVGALQPGEHVVFLNSKLTRVKLYSPSGIISYYRAPKNSNITVGMIEFIPRCFGAKGMNWEEAEKLAFDKALKELK